MIHRDFLTFMPRVQLSCEWELAFPPARIAFPHWIPLKSYPLPDALPSSDTRPPARPAAAAKPQRQPAMLRVLPNFISSKCPPPEPVVVSQLPPPIIYHRRRILKTHPSKSRNNCSSHQPDLRKLTSRVVDLTRRKQLHQIFEEVEDAKRQHGKLNTIVMNAVVEACVHCGDVDSALQVFREMSKRDGCGVDNITFAIILKLIAVIVYWKGLGEAQRTDEAFQLLESVERGTAAGSPQLSPSLIYGLLNALLEGGDLRRAYGLLARYRSSLQGGSSIIVYNLLMKGYTNSDFPLDALTVRDEILRQGLKPDRLTYNTLVFACVKSGRMDTAVQFFEEMKGEAKSVNCLPLSPDAVTYTTLIKETEIWMYLGMPRKSSRLWRKPQYSWLINCVLDFIATSEGFANFKDLLSVHKLVVEMKSSRDLFIDRVAYTAMVDAFLNCGSTEGALCVFGEMIKRTGENQNLRPKPHLYLSLMRTFATKGDYDMVKRLHVRMRPDSVGAISTEVQVEADELLMEAAVNSGQTTFGIPIYDMALRAMVAVRVEALSGFNSSMFSPYILPQVSLDDPIKKYMIPFVEANPLLASLELKQVTMCFYREAIVPVIDDWGCCVGLIHREDCNQVLLLFRLSK
ncbi:hypothetical protein ACLOJK_030639 [Asimina triloba]